MSADDVFDVAADVVIVGSGGAGYAAAVSAAAAGASVLILEAASVIGGTTAAGGATAWVPNNRSMRERHGLSDPKPQALQYLCRLAFPQSYDPTSTTLGLAADDYALIETFYDEGSAVLDAFAELGALSLEADVDWPDYHADLPENAAPRGRHLHPPPGFAPLVNQLADAAERLGVEVRLDHRVIEVLRNGAGEVVGVEARTGPRTVLARARKAVIFATGGFVHDPDLVRQHLPGKVFGGCSVPTTIGDFVRIGQALGTPMGNMHRAFWKQVVVEHAVRNSHAFGPFLPYGDSMLQVNKYGHRVVNEKSPYNERSQVHFHWNPTKREYSNLLMFMIWDDALAQNPEVWPFRSPVPLPGEPAPHVIVGSDLDDLTGRIDERLESLAPHTGGARLAPDFASALAATIDEYNDYAETGKDLAFGRGETPIEIAWNGAGRPGSPNPTMAPFRPSGPYHCVILGAGVLDTNGGPRINTNAQVLGGDGTPIAGLYGAGNCVASINGQAYWGPGATIGPALTFGYLAGRAAAAEQDKPVD